MHLEEGRILKRNGKAPPLHERGRKDVYNLGPGETVEIYINFRDFPGKYVIHCHNTVHEDHAMMIRFDVKD
jgi:FtsP/CotA-like multicopper oxidase with cupredoxin domain